MNEFLVWIPGGTSSKEYQILDLCLSRYYGVFHQSKSEIIVQKITQNFTKFKNPRIYCGTFRKISFYNHDQPKICHFLPRITHSCLKNLSNPSFHQNVISDGNPNASNVNESRGESTQAGHGETLTF